MQSQRAWSVSFAPAACLNDGSRGHFGDRVRRHEAIWAERLLLCELNSHISTPKACSIRAGSILQDNPEFLAG
jgi:hypothetical protein